MAYQTFALLLQGYPNTTLIIVRDVEERVSIENRIENFGVNYRVALTSYQTKPRNYLAMMNVFLLSLLSG